ncbi:amidohydrolase [Flammeovirga pectinis]|uniref:Amidohydrolase n=1 Tax=Flammeovirga pectinis TaxID=2494373 RepID=A0A3S9PAN8_9BACT|nr:amidohydrolase [Flammeovirga pectinis]AZQ65305.1 amidohydrolase [Flammeovirga pectinis]
MSLFQRYSFYKLLLFLGIFLMSCDPNGFKEKADHIYYNGHVYTVDNDFTTVEAFAVKDEEILAVGTTIDILKNYTSKDQVDLNEKFIYPGFIDAHSHFFWLAEGLNNVDLSNTNSWEEVIKVLKEENKKTPKDVIIGYGWDNTKWINKRFPTKGVLDKYFKDTPVILSRIDGHAMWVNSKVLELAEITNETDVQGGEIVKYKGEPTGILVDNAMEFVNNLALGKVTRDEIPSLILEAQDSCFKVGLTGVSDFGYIEHPTLMLYDSLYKEGELKIHNYAMLDASLDGVDYMLSESYIENEEFPRAIKIRGDGALGSRGACLLSPYKDKKNAFGQMVLTSDKIREISKIAFDKEFQVCVHAIGDSTNREVLKIFSELLEHNNDRRWRVEHAQIVNPEDVFYFKNYSIIPSVQPTHATSDMDFAIDRLGEKRIQHSYTFQTLLNQNNWLPLGTDFPVEPINPLYTFYAAVARKDRNGLPEQGFQIKEALTRQQALRGMTSWAAKAQFMEDRIGSIEEGKEADFIILDQDIMEIDINKVLEVKVLNTYIKGNKVY